MPLQLLAVDEGADESLDDLCLLRAERIWRRGVDRREVRVLERILLSADLQRTALKIELVEQQPVIHFILRVRKDILPLELELYDAYRLVHLRDDRIAVILISVRFRALRREAFAGVVLIDAHGEHRQRPDVYPVAVLKEVVVVVAQADTHGVRDAAAVPRRRAHPENVVVAPLDVDIALLLQLVYHQMRAVAAVEYIADDVQLINDRILHKVAQRDNELIRPPYVYDRVYDLAVIFLFVEVLAAGGHKLGYDVLEVLRQHLPDL